MIRRHTLRILSDLYLTPSKLKTLKDAIMGNNVGGPRKTDVLAILGDVTHHGSESPEFREGIRLLSHTARHVVLVLGDREQLSTYEMMAGHYYAEKALEGISNVIILNQRSIVLYGKRYIGCTLWTDTRHVHMKLKNFNETHPLSIGVPPNLICWDNLNSEHNRDTQYLNTILSRYSDKKSAVILTHHSPLITETNPTGDHLLYSSDQRKLMTKYRDQIILWAHGHTKYQQQRLFLDIPVICNPLWNLSIRDLYEYRWV